MNGYETPAVASGVFGSYSSTINGHGSPEPPSSKAKSGAKSVFEQRKNFTKTSINSLTDTSQYHVEHLTTFVLDRKDGLLSVEDGVRRLRLLDARGKVWTQEMLLQVDNRTVSLIDLETQSELESFPVASLQRCQAVMNACGYDSILALICREAGQSKADLHLFQCDVIKANLIQVDVESAMMDAKGGKVKKRPEALKMILKSDGLIPPPPAAPAPEPPPPPPSANQTEAKTRAAAWSAWTNEQPDCERQTEDEAPLETTAARVDRDVQILNHILDDIEFFITKLQKAAEAFSELSKRKKAKKGKKKSPGEGVLTLRSKPPTEEEFVDCLQKFKHAFNQLAKLKDHIQNPSSVDLLHFLFSPLRMVIQAGGVDLARSVVVPLLSRESIEFLHGSGTAEERHLWVALGDGWTKSRLEWPRDQYFPCCELSFRDGWQPPASPPSRQEVMQLPDRHDQVDRYSFSGAPFRRMHILDQSAVATLKHAAGRHGDGDQPLFAKSKYDFVARNSTELSVLKDEILEVLDDRKQWWKVRNGCGAAGYVPNNILESSRAAEPIYSHTIQKQTPRADFIRPVVTATPPPPPPAPSRLPTPPLPPPQADPPPAGRRHSDADGSVAPGNDRAVAPGNDRAVTPGNERRETSSPGRKSNMEEVQDELVHRLTLGRSANRKCPPRSGGAAAANISYESTADDVKVWLETKGFSPVTVSSLGVLTGAQLFSLTKDELRTVCPDGGRVFSQVAVQKAALEAAADHAEFVEIMRRRQELLSSSP